ncbi:MAG: hypothetical protein Q8T13_23630 [Acidobacteriota bacterium]|nr:hypothetical protein [Acidobacteriota bacterium]
MTAFYHVDPEAWLFRVPIGVIRAYVGMLPKLRARDSLLEVQRLGVGTGSFKKDDQKSIQRDWREAADLRSAGKSNRVVATPEQLGSMGIAMRRPKKT